MSVYVDGERNSFGRMVMCHMWADSVSELLGMADKIGLQRKWFQPLSFPHFDGSLGYRARAVAAGAIEVDRREGSAIRRRLRENFSEDDIAQIRAAIPAYDAQHKRRPQINPAASLRAIAANKGELYT
jgi:hypothetical protein